MASMTHPARRALVTGAASGLGAEFSRQLAADGWQLLVTDQDEAALQTLAASLPMDGDNISTLRLDVTRDDHWQAALDLATEAFGGIDLLVNNAGVAVGGDFVDTPLSDWDWVLDIDLLGVVRGCKTFLPQMLERDHGHVINIASFAGLAGAPQISAYGVAKAGVVALSEALRAETADTGVGITVVCPAFVETNLTDTMRSSDPGHQDRVRRWMKTSGVTVADVVSQSLEAMANGDFLVLTHRDTRWYWRLKRWWPSRYFKLMTKVRKRR